MPTAKPLQFLMAQAASAASKSDPATDSRIAANRFVSTLAGAFRSFYIYHQDNKAFDEIMQNLAKRFQDLTTLIPVLRLAITNRSLLLDNEPVGFREITIHLAAALRALGYKEITMQPPIQARHFFQLLHILSGKDSDDSKNEKLLPFIADGETKPIALVPFTGNGPVVRLNDDAILRQLAPVRTPKSEGGFGLIEALSGATLERLPDLFTFIAGNAAPLPDGLRNFVLNLTDATREGFFPTDRFLKLFPLPAALSARLLSEAQPAAPRPRAEAALDQSFVAVPGRRTTTGGPVESAFAAFTGDEVEQHRFLRGTGAASVALEDLDLAESLLRQSGSNQVLGLCFLLRYMGDKNPVAVQERSLKIANEAWNRFQAEESPSPNVVSLFSSIRERLADFNNVSLMLFPLRTATVESAAFADIRSRLLSLGSAVMPAILKALDVENDRGMRRKLCQLLSDLARQTGPDALVETMSKASPFLLRNIVMVLGDIKAADAVRTISPFLSHAQKIVRIEAVRSLLKIGNEDAMKAIVSALPQMQDTDAKQLAIDAVVQKRSAGSIDTLIRLARAETEPGPMRRKLITAIGMVGGPAAKVFLESLASNAGFMSRFSAEQREETSLVKTLLDRLQR